MKRMLIAVAVAVLGFACVPGNGPLMAPGEDCIDCHGGDGGARPATSSGTRCT